MRVLIVDDNHQMRKALAAAIKKFGYESALAAGGNAALNILDDSINVVISDIRMPEMSGVDLLKKIRKRFSDMPVILVTAYGSVALAVEAFKLGASDFIIKPFNNKILKEAIDRAARFVKYENDIIGDKFIGNSPDILKIKNILRKVADTDMPVLLCGESGTGKEVIARYIHTLMNGSDKQTPFVAINCSAVPENLFESEMFGYEKGAFTDAAVMKEGKFEEASNGILFADEITEMPGNLQAKLLRVLQEKEIVRIGGKKIIPVNFRFISSTNRDIKDSIEEKKIREDAMQAGLKQAVMVPLGTAQQSYEAIEIAEVVAKNGNPASITDVGVGVQSAYTGVLGGIYNVLINLKDICNGSELSNLKFDHSFVSFSFKTLLTSEIILSLLLSS